MTDGFGAVTWWGFSPALDFQDKCVADRVKDLELENETESKDELCLLLVGSGDSRHILKTIARAYRHGNRSLHFFILENSIELYARHVLFLAIALEAPSRMGLQEKTELFLELYGNIMVRQQSCEYVQKMANEFIKMVTDFDYLEKVLPILDFRELKFKERDFLEGIFKFWRNPDVKIFEVWKFWDARLRQYLKARYDTRMNAFDWDYHMNLLGRGGHVDIIHKSEYAGWREKGVAFQVREGAYDVPNKTMASGLIIKQDGENQAKRGYWGDIIVSPYIAIGMETEETSMYKKYNDAFGKTAQDVAEYNVLSMFHEISTRECYVLPDDSADSQTQESGPKLTEITEEEEEVILQSNKPSYHETVEPDHPITNPLDLKYEAIPLSGVKVTLLPINSLSDMPNKSKFKNKFDLVYFSNSMVHQLTPETSALFKDEASLILETAKFMLELKGDATKQFTEKITSMAQTAGCKPVTPCDGSKEDFAFFSYQRPTISPS